MLKKYLAVLIIAGNIAHQLHADKAYIANINENTVSIFNVASNTITGTVTDLLTPSFNTPNYIVFAPDGQSAYVSSFAAVSVINVATDSVTTSIPVGTLNRIQSLAITPNGTKMYAVSPAPTNAIGILDLSTNTYTANVDDSYSAFNDPQFIAISPDGITAYVTNKGDQTVKRINLATDTVDLSIPSGLNAPSAIVCSPDGANLYVGDILGYNLAVISTATNTIINNISASSIEMPSDLIFSGSGNTLYIVNSPAPMAPNYPSVLTAYDPINDVVISTDPGSMGVYGSYFFYLAPYYDTPQNANTMSVINPSTSIISGMLSWLWCLSV